MSEFKGTKGKCYISQNYHVWSESGCKVADCSNTTQSSIYRLKTDEEMSVNSNLILDAFKVRQQINCELSELLEQRNEMLEMLEELAENLSLQLGRLGCCGEGDGKDHKADNDSYGGNEILQKTKQLIKQSTEI